MKSTIARVLVLGAAVGMLVAPTAVLTQSAPDWPRNQAEALKNLQELVKIDTSNPPGNETKVAQYVKAILDKEGIPAEIIASEPNRGNLIARIKGNGKKRPILLAGHSDVVGVEREKWTEDPFGGAIKDGYIYGRGSYDDKDNLAVSLQVVLMLHRMKVPLDRDIILVSEAAEEGGGGNVGIGFLVNQHWAKLDSEFAILEGGETLTGPNGKIISFGVATTEKVPNGTRLVAKGTSGHGSIPRPDNPIVHLAAAVAKLGEFQPPMRLNETTRAYFQRLAAISSPEDAFMYTHLEDPVLGPAIQEKLRMTKFSLNSMLRTSISPNIIKGGFRSNVIPGDAEATLDIRAVPDEDMGEFVAMMKRVINDPAVEVIAPGGTRPKTSPSRMDTEMFRALEKAQAGVIPGAVTLPMMLTGATDGAQLRAKGVQVYGVGSVNEGRLHGNDERISIDGFNKLLEIVYRAVVEVAAAK